MHRVNISNAIIERAGHRRDKFHPYAEFDPRRTALIVVDMQNGFIDPIYPTAVAGAGDIVPNINRIARAMRDAGGTVVWLQNSCGPEAQRTWGTWFENFVSSDVRAAFIEALTDGTPGFELWPELDVDPGDEIIVKTRFSAFVQGSSNIETVLRDKGIDTLLITGTVTNVCCESTARDAAMLNFRVAMVADGNAARTDEEHNAALSNLFNVFADVLGTEEILARLEVVSAEPARRRA